jgi:hypothetical protein
MRITPLMIAGMLALGATASVHAQTPAPSSTEPAKTTMQLGIA